MSKNVKYFSARRGYATLIQIISAHKQLLTVEPSVLKVHLLPRCTSYTLLVVGYIGSGGVLLGQSRPDKSTYRNTKKEA